MFLCLVVQIECMRSAGNMIVVALYPVFYKDCRISKYRWTSICTVCNRIGLSHLTQTRFRSCTIGIMPNIGLHSHFTSRFDKPVGNDQGVAVRHGECGPCGDKLLECKPKKPYLIRKMEMAILAISYISFSDVKPYQRRRHRSEIWPDIDGRCLDRTVLLV